MTLTVEYSVCERERERKTKDRADSMSDKSAIPLDGIRTCTSGVCVCACVHACVRVCVSEKDER